MKKRSIKTQLTFFTIAVIAALSVITVSLLGGWIVNLNQYNHVIQQYYSFTALSNEINQAYIDLNSYIQNPNHEIRDKYSQSMDNAKSAITDIKDSSAEPDIYYAMVGIENMILEADRINREIMEQLNLDSFNDIYASHMESQTLLNYINISLASTNKLQNEFTQARLFEMTERFYLILTGLAVFSSITIAALIVFSVNFSRRLSTPLRQISEQARELAGGNLDARDIPEQGFIEFSMIASSLNTMKSELAQTIAKIREQSDIALKLQKSELENLRISNDLKNTELRVMQAQINPHFLFNTLNSISRLALHSGDEEVVNLIEALSRMLRYNLNHIDRAITLREEIENLENYFYIQEIRFRNKLLLTIENNSRRQDLQMPCLTLQPILENAIMHGLKPYNYEGSVRITISDREAYTEVLIRDDGIGMQPEEMARMVNGTYENDTEAAKHTSIGFKNVMGRLNAFFSEDDCVSVASEIGEGTVITLKIYCKRSGSNV